MSPGVELNLSFNLVREPDGSFTVRSMCDGEELATGNVRSKKELKQFLRDLAPGFSQEMIDKVRNDNLPDLGGEVEGPLGLWKWPVLSRFFQ